MGSFTWVTTQVSIVITHIGGLITPLVTSHEPPSIESKIATRRSPGSSKLRKAAFMIVQMMVGSFRWGLSDCVGTGSELLDRSLVFREVQKTAAHKVCSTATAIDPGYT